MHMMSTKRLLPIIAVPSGVLLLDQMTKSLAKALLLPPLGGPITVLPFFDLRIGFNRGIAFGLLSTNHPATSWALSAFAVLVVVVLYAWMRQAADAWQRYALALVIGGAFGNVTDRLRQGMVTDFLDFHVGGWHWPAFNLADSSIVVGAALLAGHSLFSNRGPAPNHRSA